jgi:branched-chain amino acid transport system permease protein
MFMLVTAIAMFVFLLTILTRTRVGLIIQASLTHPNMVAMLGHDVPKIFMLVFGVGAALAGLAGVIAGPALVTQPSMAALLGPILFVVIVVGGLGSLSGAFVASILIGLVQTFAVAINASLTDLFGPTIGAANGDLGNVTVAQVAPVIPYLLLVLILIFRPTGPVRDARIMTTLNRALPWILLALAFALLPRILTSNTAITMLR